MCRLVEKIVYVMSIFANIQIYKYLWGGPPPKKKQMYQCMIQNKVQACVHVLLDLQGFMTLGG